MGDTHAETIIAGELNEFEQAICLLKRLHECKARQYLDSWCKRGEAGVYHNVMRKLDRMENIYQPYADHEIEIIDWFPLVDCISDTAVYNLKWLGRMREWHPEALAALEAYVCEQERLQAKEK